MHNVAAAHQCKGIQRYGSKPLQRALKAFVAQSGSPREDIDWNNSTPRQRGRMFYMASPVAMSAIKTNRTSVIGIGLQFRSRIDRAILGLNRKRPRNGREKLRRNLLYGLTKKTCDAIGINNFAGLQQLALQSMAHERSHY